MKNIKSKWKWIAVVLLTTTVLIAFSWEFLVSKSIEAFLYDSISNLTGRKLAFDGLYHEKEYWVIDRPRSCDGDHCSDNAHFHASRATFSYAIDLWNGEIDLYVTLEEPELTMNLPDPDLAIWLADLSPQAGLFTINRHVAIHKGRLALGEHSYAIDGEISLRSNYEGHFYVDFNEGLANAENNHLFMHFSKDLSTAWQMDFQCKEVECSHLHHAASHLYPILQEIKIHDGILNGTGGIIFENNHRPLIYGEATLAHFHFQHIPSDVKGALKEVRFHLQKDPIKPISHGSVIFCGDETLTFAPQGSLMGELRNIMGGIYVDEKAQANIALEGIYDNFGQTHHLLIQGEAALPTQGPAALDLMWRLENQQEKSRGRVKINEQAEKQFAAQMELEDLRLQDTKALQTFLQRLFPSLQEIYLKEGTLNLSANAYIDHKKIDKLTLNHISVKDLKIDYLPYQTSIAFENILGHAKFDFVPDMLEDETNLQLTISGGKVNTTFGTIEDIQSQLHISRGSIVNSYVKGRSGGMHAHMDMGAEGSSEIKLFLKGNLNEAIQRIPSEKWRVQFAKAFGQHEFAITADIKHHDHSEEINGIAKLRGPQGEEKPITFGFEIFKRGHRASTLHKDIEEIQAFLPLVFLDKETHTETGYCVGNGWFHALGLPLEKYLAPLFLDETVIQLSGIGHFHGHFDDQALMVTYEAENVNLENEAFAIEAAEIRQDPLDLSRPVHFFDFNTGMHFGLLPVENASYFEKNCELSFTDICADIVFEGGNIHIPGVESFCHGIYLEGSLDIDLNDLHQGCFDVDIRTQAMHGKLSQVQNLFSHFEKPLFFLKVPMEGEVTMHQDAGRMHLAFSPGSYDMQAHLKGALTEGSILANNTDISLQSLSLNFEYDHQSNILDFSEIQGTLLVGEPEKAEEYTIVGERVHFSDYAHNSADFDIWIGDKKRDVIRVAGKTVASKICPGEDCVQIILDQNLSHFGNIYPQTFHLILKDWCQVQEFQLQADVKLATLFQDLQRFSRTGFLFLSRHSLKQLNDIKKAEGSFRIDVGYNDKRSLLNYHVAGKDVAIGSHEFKKVLLEGKKSDNTWAIDQLVLDQVSIAADILRKPGSWSINFLGVQLGSSILMGLQGEYFDDSRIADGKINLLEIDIDALKEWPKAQEFLSKSLLKGHLRASGSFHYECCAGEAKSSKWDASLNASVKDWGFKGLHFDDINQMTMQYSADRGLTISNIQTALKTGVDSVKKAYLSLEKLSYDPRQDVYSLENLAFKIPFFNIIEVIAQASQSFPSAFSPAVADMLSGARKNNDLEGSLSLDFADPHYAIKLALKDGEYCFQNKKFSFSNFVLDYDPCEISMVAKCYNYAVPFWIQYKSSCMTQGEIVISESPPEHFPENPLVIKWQNHLEQGPYIHQASGHFHGMTFALKGSIDNTKVKNTRFLDGEIHFNAQEAAAFLSRELGENFSAWQIGAGYILKGRWELLSALKDNELMKIGFAGHLQGQNFEFKGFQFDKLYAEMHASPELVFMENIRMTDPCGNLFIEELRFNKLGNDLWKMSLSKAQAHDFKPSLLQKTGISQSSHPKPFVVRELALENLQGILGNSNSLTAEGSLEFINPPEKNTNHPLLAIPGEILTNLGLDLSILNPVIGTIFYEIKDSKILLTKLKDTYSQAKMSKFYLANNAPQSYVDFDGNLHIQIKMKHYNIFFKLAELFTVTVQGTWLKPTYTLQKQKK